MEKKLLYRLEHSAIFPDEKDISVDNYLSGVKRELILKTGSYLSAFKKGQAAVRDNVAVLSMWFNSENNGFANDVYKKIKTLDTKHGRETIIINIYTTLRLLEKGLHQKGDSDLSNTEIEKRIFKSYLLLNELDNNKDNNIYESLNGKPDEIKWPLLVLTQTFRYSDISNFSLREVFSEQFVRAIRFFFFIEKKYPAELNYFVSFFGCKSWQEYIQRLFPLVKSASNNHNGFTEISVKDGPSKEKDIEFIGKFALGEEHEELKELDFVSLRSKPLLKFSNDSYRVIYDLFVFEKVFNGIYFTLIKMPGMTVEKLKRIFTFEFSEKTMLYYVLKNIFHYSIKQFTGEQLDKLKIKAAPDYYVRKRTKILLFESKDVVLNSSIKESTSFETYEAEIKKKLYFYVDEETGKIKQKAILQLVHNIEEILTQGIKYDHVKKGTKIYPILVIHHRQLNVAGLNELLNVWFREEMKKLADKGLNIRRVAPLTLINISTLIFYADYFAQKKYSLEKMIDQYHQASRRIATIKNKTDLENTLLKRIYPFNIFVANKIKRRGKDSLLMKNVAALMGKAG